MPGSFANPAVTNPSISANNNRITSAGWGYDAAGNTLTDAGAQTYVYDGENKMVKASNGSGTLGEYFYDGDGKRVKKIAANDGGTTIFVYDAAGKLVAEYSQTVASVEDAKVAYLTNDHLGSPRINTDRDGNVTARHDYHPFGEEIVTTQRTGHSDYTPDSIRKQFTGYERDGETGLDFAQARMFGSGFGRFTSPDDFRNDSINADPASWNLYIYVRNNPLKFTDPTGEELKIGKNKGKDGKPVDSLSEEEKKKLLAWLNHVYNCDGCVSIDNTGTIRLDASKVKSQKVIDATKDLTAAIQDKKSDIDIFSSPNDAKVAFARGGRSEKGANFIFIDFKDFDRLSGHKDARSSFTNYFFVHEVLHFYPVVDGRENLSGNDQTGTVENRVNEMRHVNNDLLRAEYIAETSPGGFSSLDFGKAKIKNGVVQRNHNNGIIAEKSKSINWIKSQVSNLP